MVYMIKVQTFEKSSLVFNFEPGLLWKSRIVDAKVKHFLKMCLKTYKMC
jgi:hypothetical protein